MFRMQSYLKLIRINQWIKNFFVFIPLFFSGRIFDAIFVAESFVGFILFSLVASSIYIINDYVDIEKDKKHPEKKFRPLASGVISKKNALILFFILVFISFIGIIGLDNYKVGLILLSYFLLNIAYSFKLKQIAILDVMIIATGFLMRVLVGGYITGIIISDWTILLTFTLALILALGKRRGELINLNVTGTTRKSLDGYNEQFVNAALIVASTITVVCYLMFILSPETQLKFHHYIVYTFVFVFAGILRYLQQTFVFEKSESPTKLIFKDPFLQILILIWGVAYFLLIYYK